MYAHANVQPYLANVQNAFRPQSSLVRPPSTPAYPARNYGSAGERKASATATTSNASKPFVAVTGRSCSRGSEATASSSTLATASSSSASANSRQRKVRVILHKKDTLNSSASRQHTAAANGKRRSTGSEKSLQLPTLINQSIDAKVLADVDSTLGSHSSMTSKLHASTRHLGQAGTGAKHELVVGKPVMVLKEMADRLLRANQAAAKEQWRPMRNAKNRRDARKGKRVENLRLERNLNQQLRNEHSQVFNNLNNSIDILLADLARMDIYITLMFKQQSKEQRANKKQHEAMKLNLTKVTNDLVDRREKVQKELSYIEKTLGDLHQLKHDLQSDPNHAVNFIEPWIQNKRDVENRFSQEHQALKLRLESISNLGQDMIEDQLKDIIDIAENSKICDYITLYLSPVYDTHRKLTINVNQHHDHQALLERQLQELQNKLDELECESPDYIAQQEYQKRYCRRNGSQTSSKEDQETHATYEHTNSWANTISGDLAPGVETQQCIAQEDDGKISIARERSSTKTKLQRTSISHSTFPPLRVSSISSLSSSSSSTPTLSANSRPVSSDTMPLASLQATLLPIEIITSARQDDRSNTYPNIIATATVQSNPSNDSDEPLRLIPSAIRVQKRFDALRRSMLVG